RPRRDAGLHAGDGDARGRGRRLRALRLRAFADLADPALRSGARLPGQRSAQRAAAHRVHGGVQHVGAAGRLDQLERQQGRPADRRAAGRQALRRRRRAAPRPAGREAAPGAAPLAGMTASLYCDGREISGAELEARAARIAGGLDAAGVREDDVVALLLRNEPAYLEAMLACRQLGAYHCPINWHFKGDEAGYLLRDSGAKVLLTRPDLLAQVGDEI